MNDGMERCAHGHPITSYESASVGSEPADAWVQPTAGACPFCRRDPSDQPLPRRRVATYSERLIGREVIA